MQIGQIYYHGNDCEGTRDGKHHYEDIEDGTLWCRMCGYYIDDEETIVKIKENQDDKKKNMFDGISEQFIVINKKRFEEMRNSNGEQDEVVMKFYEHLIEFSEAYEKKTGKELDQEYIVCNQDEPYAEQVWQIIKGDGSKYQGEPR